MKAYVLKILIIDHDELGEEGISNTIENTKYPNYCIDPDVLDITEFDIGKWTDNHPLNNTKTKNKVTSNLQIGDLVRYSSLDSRDSESFGLIFSKKFSFFTNNDSHINVYWCKANAVFTEHISNLELVSRAKQ